MKRTEKTDDIIYESHGDLFSKSNALIGSKYKATLVEQKLLNIVLSQLQRKQYEDAGENGGLICTMTAAELRKMLGISGGGFYAQLKTAAAAMTARTIGFVNDDIQAFKYISLITSAEYMDGCLTVKFNYELKKYLTQDAPFTVLDLPIILSYHSVYALRLHEILLSKCYKKKRPGVSKYTKKESTDGHFKITIGLSELKLSLGVVNAESNAVRTVLNGSAIPDYDKAVEKATEKSFDEWYEFRRKVIDVAVKEINETDNGTMVSYTPLKGGKSGKKVNAIEFTVDLGNKKDIEKNEKKSVKEESVLSEDEMFELQYNVKTLIKEKISLKDIKTICKAANYDMDKIRQAYEIACESSNVKNLVGFMIKAIQDEYMPPIHKEKKKNSFNNFEQRQYDFADFEREILNKK